MAKPTSRMRRRPVPVCSSPTFGPQQPRELGLIGILWGPAVRDSGTDKPQGTPGVGAAVCCCCNCWQRPGDLTVGQELAPFPWGHERVAMASMGGCNTHRYFQRPAIGPPRGSTSNSRGRLARTRQELRIGYPVMYLFKVPPCRYDTAYGLRDRRKVLSSSFAHVHLRQPI